jgi:hypothetical protein
LGVRELTYAQACKANGKTCKKNDQCCSKNCVGGTGSGSTAHSAGVCQPATGCGGSTTLCGTDCVDLTTDPANCGRCGNPCVSGACQNGECCTTGTCGSLTCPATADICTGPALAAAVEAFRATATTWGRQSLRIAYGMPSVHCRGAMHLQRQQHRHLHLVLQWPRRDVHLLLPGLRRVTAGPVHRDSVSNTDQEG